MPSYQDQKNKYLTVKTEKTIINRTVNIKLKVERKDIVKVKENNPEKVSVWAKTKLSQNHHQKRKEVKAKEVRKAVLKVKANRTKVEVIAKIKIEVKIKLEIQVKIDSVKILQEKLLI